MTIQRITDKMIQEKIDYLNKITGNPSEPYTKNAEGRFVANIGNYHRSGAYGGVTVYQMSNDSGGVTNVRGLSYGHVPKRELYEKLCSFIAGIELAKENQP
jgi:hypothetical protein